MIKRNTSTLFLASITLVCTMLLSACADKSQNHPNIAKELKGTWKIEEILMLPVIDRSPAQFVFLDENKLAGSASCNKISSSYVLDSYKNTLSFTPVAATRMMCEPTLMNQEMKFLSALEKVSKVKIEQSTLYLYDKQNELIFSASKVDSKPAK